jgi:hypothetical protein
MDAREQALDAALTRALQAPPLPPEFRSRVHVAIAQVAADERTVLARLEQERRERLAEFEAGYVRLRLRTLVALFGGAAVAGAAVALSLPWFTANFGADAPLALASAGAVAGLAVGVIAWLRSQGYPNPLELL